MMLMVESLPTATERDLLFLIAMLQKESGRGVPQQLIRFFLRRLHHRNPSQSSFKYFSALQFLEDNSLVQIDGSEREPNSVEGSTYIDAERLTIHSLRREYIRQKHLPALQSLASGLMAGYGGHHDGRLLDVQDSDQCLVVALGTACFDESLTAEVTFPFQSLMTLMNKGEVPRSLEQQVDARELVKSAREMRCSHVLDYIMPLLNLEGEEGWKQQVHANASKHLIFAADDMKLVCMEEIDDESMASFLAISHVRAASFKKLNYIYQGICREDLRYSCYYGERKAFSFTHYATWKEFSSIYSKNLILLSNGPLRTFLHSNITHMLQFESGETISTALQKLREFASQSRDPDLQHFVDLVFLRLHDSRLTSEMLNELDLHQYFPAIVWKPIDKFDHVQSSSITGLERAFGGTFQQAMRCVYRDKGYVNILLKFRIPLEEWLTNISCFRRLLRLEKRYGPHSLLGLLSATPEFKAKATGILKGDWWEEDFTLWSESHGGKLARFWGNVALLRDLHDTTRLRLVKIAEKWMAEFFRCCSEVLCSCTCFESGVLYCRCPRNRSRQPREWDFYIPKSNLIEVTRSLTIISHLHPNTLVVPILECLKQRYVTSRCTTCRVEAWFFYIQVCKGRSLAYCEMEMYAETISTVDLARQAVDAVVADSKKLNPKYISLLEYYSTFDQGDLRMLMVFVKALSKDYQGATDTLNQDVQLYKGSGKGYRYDFPQFRLCTDRAVLFRLSGEFSKAIHNFNLSLEHWENMTSRREYIKSDPRVHNLLKYCLLRHRGYAKHLLGDLEGSQLDMNSAGGIRSSKQILEPISWDCLTERSAVWGYWSYNEVGLNYSLLQFPVDNYQLHL